MHLCYTLNFAAPLYDLSGSMKPIVTGTAGHRARHMRVPVSRNFFSCSRTRMMQTRPFNLFYLRMSGKISRISF